MNKLPPLEHTSNDTGRLLVYHIQQGDNDFNKYFLYKTAILPGGIMKPEGVVFAWDDFEWLNNQVIKQGFVPLMPHPTEDDPRIMMTYL
jgi:hypothetical protein